MVLKLLLLESDTDFYEMMPALWSAFENPMKSFLRIVFCLPSPSQRSESIRKATDCTMTLHKKNPCSCWMKVVDSQTGKLAGAVNWHIYKSNPYFDVQKPVIATSWPEGDGRNYASSYLQQVTAHKCRLFNRPHVYLNISFTVPEWRRNGAGNLMMQWGVQKADEMGLDSFVEATWEGKFLYEKHGFLHFDTIYVDTRIKNPSETWKRLERELPPEPQYLMWRPVKGLFEPGKTTLPWKTSPFIPRTPYLETYQP